MGEMIDVDDTKLVCPFSIVHFAIQLFKNKIYKMRKRHFEHSVGVSNLNHLISIVRSLTLSQHIYV